MTEAELMQLLAPITPPDEAARAAAVLGCITGINTGKAVLIVQLALFRVRKHLVGFIDFLELFLSLIHISEPTRH